MIFIYTSIPMSKETNTSRTAELPSDEAPDQPFSLTQVHQEQLTTNYSADGDTDRAEYNLANKFIQRFRESSGSTSISAQSTVVVNPLKPVAITGICKVCHRSKTDCMCKTYYKDFKSTTISQAFEEQSIEEESTFSTSTTDDTEICKEDIDNISEQLNRELFYPDFSKPNLEDNSQENIPILGETPQQKHSVGFDLGAHEEAEEEDNRSILDYSQEQTPDPLLDRGSHEHERGSLNTTRKVLEYISEQKSDPFSNVPNTPTPMDLLGGTLATYYMLDLQLKSLTEEAAEGRARMNEYITHQEDSLVQFKTSTNSLNNQLNANAKQMDILITIIRSLHIDVNNIAHNSQAQVNQNVERGEFHSAAYHFKNSLKKEIMEALKVDLPLEFYVEILDIWSKK